MVVEHILEFAMHKTILQRYVLIKENLMVLTSLEAKGSALACTVTTSLKILIVLERWCGIRQFCGPHNVYFSLHNMDLLTTSLYYIAVASV